MPMSYANRVLTVLTMLCLAAAGNGRAAEGWKAGMKLPGLALPGVEGALPDLKGKVVLIDFWGSWCGPCKLSFPALNKIHADYKSKGVVVLGVSIDDDPAAMTRFLEAHPVSFPIVRDAAHKLVESAAIEAMPTSFLVDTNGIIRSVHNGFQADKTEAEYRRQIDALLVKPVQARKP